MSGIIESIEKAQLKEHVDQFNVGDTEEYTLRSARVRRKESRCSRVLF